jgi:arsenate reductase
MDVVIWHNPSCSKSRQALELLKERGYAPTVRQYLKDPPTEAELRAVLKKLGAKDPHALVRTKEALYEALDVASLRGDAVVHAMAEHPKLIERPVVITPKAARIGRPTEAILELFEESER